MFKEAEQDMARDPDLNHGATQMNIIDDSQGNQDEEDDEDEVVISDGL